MANDRRSEPYQEYATVDTAPEAGGYFTNPVEVLKSSGKQVCFSIGDGPGAMNIVIQFKRPGDTNWTIYDTYTGSERKVVEDKSRDLLWRAGVEFGGYTSGSLTFGFDW